MKPQLERPRRRNESGEFLVFQGLGEIERDVVDAERRICIYNSGRWDGSPGAAHLEISRQQGRRYNLLAIASKHL